jgi:hypothetical protein
MTRDLLITAHPTASVADACDLGCWLPLAQPLDDLIALTHLVVLGPGAEAIEAVARIEQLEPWHLRSGTTEWLPLLGAAHPLRRPIPLGRSRMLEGWLPRNPLEQRLVSIDGLLASDSLAAYLRLISQGRTADKCAGDPWH